MARGVHLPDFDMLEQVDLMEAERRTLLIEFGREVVHVLAMAKDQQQAQALIDHLKHIYFIGYEDQERQKLKEQADELVRLSKLTFRVSAGPGGATLEIGGKK